MAVTNLSPTQIAERWSQAMGAATTRIKTGVEAVKTAPGVAAAAASGAWLSGVQNAVTKFKRNVAAVTLTSWKTDFVTKGLSRIGPGATAAQPKMANFMSQFVPFLQRTVPTLPPRGNFTQNLARSQAMIRAAHGFKYNK